MPLGHKVCETHLCITDCHHVDGMKSLVTNIKMFFFSRCADWDERAIDRPGNLGESSNGVKFERSKTVGTGRQTHKLTLMKVEVINSWTCATEFESNFWNKLINLMCSNK